MIGVLSPVSLSDVLPRLRTGVGITSQRELARRAGLSRNTVNKLETGRSSADHDTLEKLADALTRDPLTGARNQGRYDAFLAVMVDAIYGRDVSERLDELVNADGPPKAAPRSRQQTRKTDYLAPIPSAGLSREELEDAERRFEATVADIRELFRRAREERRQSTE